MSRAFISVNPFTGETNSSHPFTPQTEWQHQLIALKEAQKAWHKLQVSERIQFLPKLSALLKANADYLAYTATKEMGKPIEQAKAEVLKCCSLCDYLFKEAESALVPRTASLGSNQKILLAYEPMGVILGIFPWNFPYWQILRSALPAIISGNAMLIKPAPSVPECSLALQKILHESQLDFPVLETAFIAEKEIAEVIAQPQIAAVTLTGSEKAGAIVAAQAAACIKPAVLELGGSDPAIVLADCNPEEIIDTLITSRFQNNGQSCVSAKRLIIEASVYPEILALLKERLKKLSIGDPLNAACALGPLARNDLRDFLEAQVNDAIEKGAQILYQTENIPAQGFFYPPTLLGNIPETARAYKEELFGPVYSLYKFNNDEEALALANATSYGLGASVFGKDKDRMRKFAKGIEAGMVYFNQMVKSDPAIPFGGIKNSGFGRELGPDGLRSFCYVKSIWEA